ncbi:hypothetical protein R84B8_02756 [Treponema sp. R8-4-B8]
MAVNYLSKKCRIPRYDRGADGAQRCTAKPCRWIMWHSVALNKIPMLYKCAEPLGEAVAPGGIKLASFCSSGISCSAPGRLDLVHLHALSACINCPPPPPPPPSPLPPSLTLSFPLSYSFYFFISYSFFFFLFFIFFLFFFIFFFFIYLWNSYGGGGAPGGKNRPIFFVWEKRLRAGGFGLCSLPALWAGIYFPPPPPVDFHPLNSRFKNLYGFLSIFTLITGMVIYLLFRNLNNMLLFSWIPKPIFLNNKLVQLQPSVFSDILLYNIPDALWFVSAILFLRFIWFYKTKEQTIYIICFYIIGFVFEISQISEKIPGTFDWLDLLFLFIGAFVEGLLYKKFILRRLA